VKDENITKEQLLVELAKLWKENIELKLLHEPPDKDFFRCQAQEYGIDEKAYMEALHRVPIIPEAQIESIMKFYSQLGELLTTMRLEPKRQLEAADQAVREQQELLKLVWEMSNDGFWDWNIEKDELYFSPRWTEILGYSQEELKPQIHTWKNLVHPDDITAAMKAFVDHLQGLTPKYEFEYRMLTKSGKWKWIMVRGQVVARNEAGQPLRIAGINIDITERKQTEAALIQSQDKFSKAFQFSPDPMSITTLKEGLYIQVNDAYLKTTGYREDEVIGRTIWELDIWVETEGRRDIIIKQIYECGGIRNIETKFRLKSGEIKTALISAEIIDIDGEAHLLIITRDITERKKMEEALRLSEECFSKAFDASPVLMAISRLEEGKFIKANKAFCRTLGYSREEIIGQSTLELGLCSDPADRNLIKQRLMANQSVQDMEIRFCKKTGEQGLGLLSAEKLDVHGEICILTIVTDITELRQMEVEMTRLDRLNIVGEMAASIGHEIRNPMTTVRGYLQLLQQNKNYHQEIEYFDLMIEELDSANIIITEFLSLAKNKMVEMKLRNLNEIISKSLLLIQANAISQDKHIKLELHDLPDLLLDEKEIRQLILNLVNNGMESMSSTGDVTIRTVAEKENVVLAVEDQGHGIGHELLDKLGTPFFTTKEQGTGLGLAVCYRIAARHNAKIDLETGSTGTTFYVRFPIPIVAATVS